MTPLDTVGVPFALIAQILKLYWVWDVKPVTALLVPEMLPSLMVVPVAQSAGADAPDW